MESAVESPSQDGSLAAQLALILASPPSREHEDLTLRWAQQIDETDDTAIISYITTCLREGYYDAAKWVLSASAVQTQPSRIRNLVKNWAFLDDEVGCRMFF